MKDDLISRQAAIDVVEKWFNRIELNGEICIDGLISLPSVTPISKETNKISKHFADYEDAISRRAAIDALRNYKVDTNEFPYDENVDGYNDGLDMAITELSKLPSVTPQRMRGRWIYGENDGQDGWYCSECGFFVPWDYDYYGRYVFLKDMRGEEE